MNWLDWIKQRDDAPHGKAFYLFITVLGLLGAGCSVALGQNSDVCLGWGVVFVTPAVFFLLGVAQAVERLGWPERATARSAGLSEKVRSQILLGRFVALAVSLGGCILASVVEMFAGTATEDFYDNLRILCFLLIFVCFCLADIAGDETFPSSMWPTAWRVLGTDLGRKPKRRRRRSLY